MYIRSSILVRLKNKPGEIDLQKKSDVNTNMKTYFARYTVNRNRFINKIPENAFFIKLVRAYERADTIGS